MQGQLLSILKTAFDWSEAEKTGHILPCEGVDEDYDVPNRTMREIEIELKKHLGMQQTLFGSDMINYVTVGKEHYQIEIPESMLAKVPQEDEAHSPYLYAKELGHPVLSSQSGSGCFVPNDVNIGGHRNACFMLLTGPNMDGKSTLLRQVCLAVILATVEYLFQMLRTRILNF